VIGKFLLDFKTAPYHTVLLVRDIVRRLYLGLSDSLFGQYEHCRDRSWDVLRHIGISAAVGRPPEYFIRLTVARTICAFVQYKGMSLQEAADEFVQKDLSAIHGDGGVVALTPGGQSAWSFNTPGMFRTKLKEGGTPQISLYREEP
jgi:hypothetical protein